MRLTHRRQGFGMALLAHRLAIQEVGEEFSVPGAAQLVRIRSGSTLTRD
jgi:hypothetical protein